VSDFEIGGHGEPNRDEKPRSGVFTIRKTAPYETSSNARTMLSRNKEIFSSSRGDRQRLLKGCRIFNNKTTTSLRAANESGN
jgi:hypothetical protein